MSQKYTLGANGFVLDRLASDPIHLSDGTLVFVYNDGSKAVLAYSSDRVTVTTIANLTSFSGAGGGRLFSVARTASDDLIVSGRSSGSAGINCYQGFVKGAGLSWTAQTAVNGVNSFGSMNGRSSLWCDTGGGTGGKGHLIVAFADSRYHYTVADAGKILAGASGPELTGSELSSTIGVNYGPHMAPDGFGASTGLAVAMDGSVSTGVLVFAWAISSSGVPTFTSLTKMTCANPIKAQVIRYASNGFAVFAPSSTSSNYAVARYSSTAQLTAPTDSGSPSGTLPTRESEPNWTVFLSPLGGGKAFLLAYNSSTGAVARLGVSLSGGVTWDSSVTAEDTLSPYLSGAQRDMQAVAQPVGSTVDWLVNAKTASTPTYALLGDYTQLNQAPNAPTLTSPADDGTLDLTSSNRFRWTFSDPDTGDSQSKFDLRYSSDGGSTWTTVSGTTPNQYVDISSGTFAAGSYEWQVRTYDALGVVGPYSSSRFFTAATPPSGLTITAPTSGEVIGASSYLVQWSAPEQDAYRVRVLGDDGAGNADTTNELYDSTKVTSSSTRSLSVPFDTNGIDAHVQVQITVSGLDSSWADVPVSVSYTPPSTPTVAVAAVQVDGRDVALAVTATHPTPTGSQPTVTYVDVYRRQVGDSGAGQRYATQQAASGTWTDWRVASGVAYEYRVRAFGDNGTYADSAWTS